MKKQRLSKVMATAGVASRRKCEELIFQGRVTVNGEKALLPQTFVDEHSDSILVEGKPITKRTHTLYFILNKPSGYLCTQKRNSQSKLVLDLFEEIEERLFTVGRLDKETSGLLLVTNDGHYANRVIHPSSNIEKEYLVKTDAEVMPEHLSAISQGTLVEGTFVKPIKVIKVRRGTLRIIIGEGKKREIRSLMKAAGLFVSELVRIRIGGLYLPRQLGPGAWRSMTEREKSLVFE